MEIPWMSATYATISYVLGKGILPLNRIMSTRVDARVWPEGPALGTSLHVSLAVGEFVVVNLLSFIGVRVFASWFVLSPLCRECGT